MSAIPNKKREYGLTPIERITRRRIITDCGCWETDFAPSKPYPSIKIEGKHKMVHRLSYEFYIGPIPKGMLVCHECDNPRCHNPDHLFLGTHLDNNLDSIDKGRHIYPTGSANDERVLALAHLTQAEIAAKTGLSQTGVSTILRRNGYHRLEQPQRKTQK